MHTPVFTYWITALASLAVKLSIWVGTPAFLVCLWYFKVRDELLIAGGVLLVTMVFGLVVLLMNGRRVICPLCRTPWFMHLRCASKPHARRWFGSAKLPVALTVLSCKSSIDCQYCGERLRWK